jgi:hypothetical protein
MPILKYSNSKASHGTSSSFAPRRPQRRPRPPSMLGTFCGDGRPKVGDSTRASASSNAPRQQLTSRKWVRSTATSAAASAAGADVASVSADDTKSNTIISNGGTEASSRLVATATARPASREVPLGGTVAQGHNDGGKRQQAALVRRRTLRLSPNRKPVVLTGGPPACGPPMNPPLARASLTWRREQPPQQPQGQLQPSSPREVARGTEGRAEEASNCSPVVRQDLLLPSSAGDAVGVAPPPPDEPPKNAQEKKSSSIRAERDVAKPSPNDGRDSEQSPAQREALASPARFWTRNTLLPGGTNGSNDVAASRLPPKTCRAADQARPTSELVRVGHHKLESLEKRDAGTAVARLLRKRGVVAPGKGSTSLSPGPRQPPSCSHNKRAMMETPQSTRQSAVKRIKLGPEAHSTPTDQVSSAAEKSGTSGKTYTDHCYRGSSRSQNRKLVKVSVDASKTPVCPHFARGESCLDPGCRLRHDVSLEASRPFCRYFQHQGQCLRADCPFRHVKVNPNATLCPTFSLLGYCDDPHCELMHLAGSSSANAATGRSTAAVNGGATSYRRPQRAAEDG